MKLLIAELIDEPIYDVGNLREQVDLMLRGRIESLLHNHVKPVNMVWDTIYNDKSGKQE